MSRTVTVTFGDDTQHVYQNVPDAVTPDIIESRATSEFSGKKIKVLDGGRQAPATAVPAPAETPVQAGIRAYKARPWGSGAAKQLDAAAYNAGGAVTDLATKAGLPPEIAAGAGFTANVGLQALPMLAGGEVSKLASPAFKSAGTGLMQSALKPGIVDLESGNAAKAIQTMLDNGINVTKGGVEAMRAQIAKLNNEITSAIQNSTAIVDKGAVASRLSDTLKKFEMQVTPQADLSTIQNAWTSFLSHPLLQGRKSMTVQEAQAMKQGTYRSIGDKPFGELSGADVEAQKQLARGLKEEVSKAVPGIDALNAKEGALLNAEDIATRRVLMEGNKNPFGLSLLAHHPSGVAAFLADRSGLAKSLLARLFYSGSEQLPATAGRSLAGIYEAQNNLPGRQ